MNDLEKQEILYNEIYNRTKDFGRSHFIKEIMRLERENQLLKEDIKGYEQERQKIYNSIPFKENQQLKDRIGKALRKIEKLYSFNYNDKLTCDEIRKTLLILKGDK